MDQLKNAAGSLLGTGASPDFDGAFYSYCVMVIRYVLPLLAIMVLSRTVRSMLRVRYEPEVWAYLILPEGERIPLRHWENTVGRARSSDIVVNYPTVSRNHAVIMRDDRGEWTMFDLGSKGSTLINGEDFSGGTAIYDDDVLSFAGIDCGFMDLTEEERISFSKERTTPDNIIPPGPTFFILTVFITLLALQNTISAPAESSYFVALAFFALIIVMWCYYLVMRSIRRSGFEPETIAFLLTALGFSVCASSAPGDMLKQVILLLLGLTAFLILGFWLRDLGRSKKLLIPAAAAAVLLLGLNVILAQEMFGARNWISIAGISFQPSEFVKIAFIYSGAATLDQLFRKGNLIFYIGFSAVCVMALALIGDFGTALIFFTTFLVISFMRSGNLATVALAITGAVLAGFLVVTIKPYIARRFDTWGHIWDYANGSGYQQTRALSASASGGLFGLGAGRGFLKNIFAADTDLVFGLISEELGYIVAAASVFAVIALALFTVKSAAQGRSSFYVVAACAAVSMMMVQTALNVFGSVDLLPFTGVTFPFVSKGGSSLIASWALLAFVKASDTRQNASFVVRLPSRRAFRESAGNDYPDNDGEYDDDEHNKNAGDEYDGDEPSGYIRDADETGRQSRGRFGGSG